MKFNAEVILHGVKESKGEINGRAFSSTTFHCEVDLKENGAGRSIGRVTRPFKLGDASEFDKWAHLAKSLPVKCEGVFEIGAGKDDGTSISLVALKPVERVQPTAPAKVG